MTDVPIKHYLRILEDTINFAIDVASTAQQATEGTKATFLFDDMRRSLHSFKESNHALAELRRHRIQQSEFGKME